MESEYEERAAAILERSCTSLTTHAACMKDLHDLLQEHGEVIINFVHKSMLQLLLSRQLKSELAVRLKEFLIRFVGCKEREQMKPSLRSKVSKLNQKCINTLKRTSQVGDTEIRMFSIQMLSGITILSIEFLEYEKKCAFFLPENHFNINLVPPSSNSTIIISIKPNPLKSNYLIG